MAVRPRLPPSAHWRAREADSDACSDVISASSFSPDRDASSRVRWILPRDRTVVTQRGCLSCYQSEGLIIINTTKWRLIPRPLILYSDTICILVLNTSRIFRNFKGPYVFLQPHFVLLILDETPMDVLSGLCIGIGALRILIIIDAK